MAAPLSGIRVVDFSRVLSGPIVGRLLADLGADVVKVEPPAGDLSRFAQPSVNSISLYYAQQNTGKRNVSIDLAHPDGATIARRLCDTADIVIENFRPGVMARHGLAYDDVVRTNPGIVYASISGYGQSGVWADRRAYALVVHAEAGLLDAGSSLRSDATGVATAPVHDAMSHADVYAGLMACNALLAALFARERTGRGDHIDVAMAEAMLFVQDFAHWGYAPTDMLRSDEWPTLAPPYSPILPSADGRTVAIAGDPAAGFVFELYCHLIGRTDLGTDERFATVEARRGHRDDLLAELAAWSSAHSAEEILAAASAVGLANGVVRSVRELVDSDWARERGVLVAVADRGGATLPVVQSPFRFAAAETGVRGVPAYRGEHNAEVLAELLGLDDAAIAALHDSGALSRRLPE